MEKKYNFYKLDFFECYAIIESDGSYTGSDRIFLR